MKPVTVMGRVGSYLIDVELVLTPGQLSVTGGELSNEVVSADESKIKQINRINKSPFFRSCKPSARLVSVYSNKTLSRHLISS